jgi:hypothetical protein
MSLIAKSWYWLDETLFRIAHWTFLKYLEVHRKRCKIEANL